MTQPRMRYLLLVALLATSIPTACGGGEKNAGPREIYVSFPPLADFARRIVGDAVAVHCPVPEGVDPAAWSPSRDEITLFQNAALVLVHGAELEGWIGKASLAASALVDVSAGLQDSFVEIVHPGHSHGAGGDGSHTHPDSHVWIDPTLAKRQAAAILSAVVARWPELEKDARAKYAQLASDFDELDKRWRALSPRLSAAKHFNASHNFAYLAKRYGFAFLGEFHLSPQQPLNSDALDILAGSVSAPGPKLLWWEEQPSEAVTKALRDRFDFRSVFVDSGESAGIAEGVDYIDVQRKNLDAVEKALAAL